MFSALALIGAALIAGIAGVVGASMNKKAQEKANETNLQLQQQANETNIQLAREANAASAVEAQKNRDWQTEMSNTAYQRQVTDMRAAGLNPYAAIDSGGAAVTGGATGHVSAASVEAGRVAPVDNGAALQSLASTAQSLAFMMALGYRQDKAIKSNEGIASLYNATRRYVVDTNTNSREWMQDRWLNLYRYRR